MLCGYDKSKDTSCAYLEVRLKIYVYCFVPPLSLSDHSLSSHHADERSLILQEQHSGREMLSDLVSWTFL